MIDITNFEVEISKPITREEFDERIKKGLIKSGDTVEVYDNYEMVIKTKYIEIAPPSWIPTIKDLQKENWQNKRCLRNIYTKQEDFWDYMKENNIIPQNIVNEIENEKYELFKLD